MLSDVWHALMPSTEGKFGREWTRTFPEYYFGCLSSHLYVVHGLEESGSVSEGGVDV